MATRSSEVAGPERPMKQRTTVYPAATALPFESHDAVHLECAQPAAAFPPASNAAPQLGEAPVGRWICELLTIQLRRPWDSAQVWLLPRRFKVNERFPRAVDSRPHGSRPISDQWLAPPDRRRLLQGADESPVAATKIRNSTNTECVHADGRPRC